MRRGLFLQRSYCVRRAPCVRSGSCVQGGSRALVRGRPCERRGLCLCLPLLGCGDCRAETRRSYKSKSNASAPSLTLESQLPQTSDP